MSIRAAMVGYRDSPTIRAVVNTGLPYILARGAGLVGKVTNNQALEAIGEGAEGIAASGYLVGSLFGKGSMTRHALQILAAGVVGHDLAEYAMNYQGVEGITAQVRTQLVRLLFWYNGSNVSTPTSVEDVVGCATAGLVGLVKAGQCIQLPEKKPDEQP